MEPISLRYTATIDEDLAWLVFASSEAQAPGRRWRQRLREAAMAAVYVGCVALAGVSWGVLGVIAATIAGFAISLAASEGSEGNVRHDNYEWLKRFPAPSETTTEVTCSDEAIRFDSPHWRTECDWAAVRRVTPTEKHLVVAFHARAAGIAIPYRAFRASGERDPLRFADEARRLVASAEDASAPDRT